MKEGKIEIGCSVCGISIKVPTGPSGEEELIELGWIRKESGEWTCPHCDHEKARSNKVEALVTA